MLLVCSTSTCSSVVCMHIHSRVHVLPARLATSASRWGKVTTVSLN
jgi:hypothetical protein